MYNARRVVTSPPFTRKGFIPRSCQATEKEAEPNAAPAWSPVPIHGHRPIPLRRRHGVQRTQAPVKSREEASFPGEPAAGLCGGPQHRSRRLQVLQAAAEVPAAESHRGVPRGLAGKEGEPRRGFAPGVEIAV